MKKRASAAVPFGAGATIPFKMGDSLRAHGSRKLPGANWRFLADERGEADELVVDRWFHIERMDVDAWWLQLGSLKIDVFLRGNGDVDVMIEGGEYPDIGGKVTVTNADTGGARVKAKGPGATGWRVSAAKKKAKKPTMRRVGR